MTLLCVLTGVFFIGYKPISYFYVSDSSVKLSRGECSDTITICTNAPKTVIDEYISWLETSKAGSFVIIRADRNKDNIRKEDFFIHAYPTFFGMKIEPLGETLTIHVEQQNGCASYLSLSTERITFTPEGGTMSVKVMTDGDSWNIDLPAGYFNIIRRDSIIQIEASKNESIYPQKEYFTVSSDNINKEFVVEQLTYDYFPKETVFYAEDSSNKETVTFYPDGTCINVGYFYIEEDDWWMKGIAEGRYHIYENNIYITWAECEQEKYNYIDNQYNVDGLIFKLQ